MIGKKNARVPKARQPYRPPKLKVHGNLRDLTQTKGGDRGDGGGPKTRTTTSP
jgi:hypothetical protein